MDKLFKILAILLLIQTLSCQKMKEVPVWNPSICQPNRASGRGDLSVVIGPNSITTLEGNDAGLPDLDSSGSWGDSGKVFTDMHGTPIAADVIYFSHYEDKYYHVKINFDVEFMKKVLAEIHYTDEFQIYEPNQTNPSGVGKLGCFDQLIFGFAPQGMVVVWRGYSGYRIEIGRYQAEIIKDDKELEKNMFPPEGMSRKDVVAMYTLPEPATCEKWDLYRKRYNLKVETISENKGFKLFEVDTENYNGEYFYEYRPKILTSNYENRALFRKIHLSWETGIEQRYASDIFFNEKKIFEKFKDVKPEQKLDLKIKIAENNGSIELLLNNEPIEVDSIRIWKHEFDYKDSYR